MLIFVDKKKERQRKIRILSLVICSILIILTNIIYFKINLHQATESLTAFQTVKNDNTWYKNSAPVYLFRAKKAPSPIVILIPDKLDRENASTILQALLQLKPEKYYVKIKKDIPDAYTLLKIVRSVLPQAREGSKNPYIIFTTKLESVQNTIYQNQLYPTTFNFKHNNKLNQNKNLTEILDNLFPPHQEPTSTIGKEKEALLNFVKENQTNLKKYILKPKKLKFSSENLFLKNVRLCLIFNKEIHCSTKTDASLKTNITSALSHFSQQNKPQKLILWTSNTPIKETSLANLENDEGLYFRYQNHEAFLLPQELRLLANPKQYLYTLKEKAGFNPQYRAQSMKLYKFKTTEVELND